MVDVGEFQQLSVPHLTRSEKSMITNILSLFNRWVADIGNGSYLNLQPVGGMIRNMLNGPNAGFLYVCRIEIIQKYLRDLRATNYTKGNRMNVPSEHLVELTAYLVSAYVGNNAVPASNLSGLIADVHGAFVRLVDGAATAPVPEPLKPAVPIKKSIEPDFMVCLEDGKRFKSLKRHLRTSYGLTPEEYREKWGLPADYPMVAPNYAEARSQLAKRSGLGQIRRRAGK